MRSKRMMGLVAAAGLAQAGCLATCSDLAEAMDHYTVQIQPCLGPGETAMTFNLNRCESAVADCSVDEEEALAEYALCLGRLPGCTPSTRSAFDNALTACARTLQANLGQTCAVALER